MTGPCRSVPLEGGQRAIVCGGPRCKVCGAVPSRMCDWKVGSGRTCDVRLCGRCTTQPRLPSNELAPDKDLCPEHARQWGRMLRARRPR